MVYPCLLIGMGAAIFELLHFRTSVGDVPLLLLSGVVYGVQLMFAQGWGAAASIDSGIAALDGQMCLRCSASSCCIFSPTISRAA